MSASHGLRILAVCICTAVIGLLAIPAANAEFALNWAANGSQTPAFNTLGCTSTTACGDFHYTPSTVTGCTTDSTLCSQTPFLYEKVTVSGVDYLHMVIGDPAAAQAGSGFAQEVYIQTGTSSHYSGGTALAFVPGTKGGNLSAYSSSSLGTCGSLTGTNTTCTPYDGALNNGEAPLDSNSTLTGNGSGNPTKVQMRQLLTDGGLTVDFVKNKFAEKPSITNSVQASDMSSVFSMNSTGNTYSSNAPSTVTNTVDLLDPITHASISHFDAVTAAQQSFVTAGAYTYAPNTVVPYSNIYGGAGGTYSYVDGGASLNQDWKSFFDSTDANPWSFQANRP